MNGQDKIIEQILLDATNYAEQQRLSGEQEYQSLVSAATSNAQSILEEEAVKAEKEKSEQLARTKIIASLDGKKQILSAKKQAVDAVFDRALEMLNNLDKSAYMSIIDRLLHEHAPENAVVLLAKNTKLTQDDFYGLSAVKAKNLGVELGGGFNGGAVVKTPTADINLSFESIMQELYDGLSQQVAEKLFG